jgi:hypothetical protein
MKKLVRGSGSALLMASLCAALCCGACSMANTDPPEAYEKDDGHGERDLGAMGAMDLSRPRSDLGAARGPLVINEVAPHGSDVDKDPDYIEIFNSGSGQVFLHDYKIRDDSPNWTTLPEDAVIPAGGYYIINCDDASMTSTQPGAHVAFKLGGSGDEVHFAAPDGTILDEVRWGSGAIEVPKGQSIGRKPDVTGPFVVIEKPTRGRPNS